MAPVEVIVPCPSTAAVGTTAVPARRCRNLRRGSFMAVPPTMAYSAAFVRSVRLCVRELHHLRPLLDFVRDERSELSRRHRHRLAAKLRKPRFELRIGEYRGHPRVEPVDDLGRRCPGAH